MNKLKEMEMITAVLLALAGAFAWLASKSAIVDEAAINRTKSLNKDLLGEGK